ncbi:MAG: excinuclease ABC subunit A [Rhodobacteraceae bacterium]|nr:excinuclease ABC subunit A [Paracoccaceae bacterium]
MLHDTRVSLLKYASGAIIGFGLLFFLSLVTPLAKLMNLFIDLAFMPYDGAQMANREPAKLLTAISGGMLVGWGLMFWLVTTRIYTKDPALGKSIMLPSILFWFLLDSIGSVIVGAWFNVIMNTGFLISVAAPILWPTPNPRTA